MKKTGKNRCDVLLVGYEDEENLGLRSIASYLANLGVNVKIEAYDPDDKENIAGVIKKEKPEIVGFSLIFQRMLPDFADLIAFLRKKGIRTHFTMGGHFPTLDYKTTLETMEGLDSIVRYEGEETIWELWQNLRNSGSLHQVEGLVYRENGGFRVNSPRPLIRDLDTLPFPVRSENVHRIRGMGICSLLASRGCYYDCSFCSVRQFYGNPPGPNRRSRSPANVVKEMEQLYNEKGVRIFIFKDDDLTTRSKRHRQWIDDFANQLKKRKLDDKIMWRISCRVDEIDAQIVANLKDVGLKCLYLGIESGNQQGLKTLNKHYNVKKIFNALNILDQLEVPFEYGFMMFDPDSTMTSIKENIAFLGELGKNGKVVVNFTKMFPYAGTPVAERLKQEGRLLGTTAAPDYDYEDKRLDLVQMFFTHTFNHRNFMRDGLVNRLQLCKFDAIVMEKFFPDKYDVQNYKKGIQTLTAYCNRSALEAMSLAVDFMEPLTYREIIGKWYYLQHLARREKYVESQIQASLDRLTEQYTQ